MMCYSVMAQAYSEKEISSTPNRSRTYDLPITTTSCKNTETVRRKIGLFYLKSLPVIHLRDMTVPPSLSSIQSCLLRFEHGLELLTTVIRGEGG